MRKDSVLSHLTANGIVRSIEESSSDAEFKENSSQKVGESGLDFQENTLGPTGSYVFRSSRQ